MKTFLIILVVVILFALTEANFKKDYCGNQDYLGNNGNKYPHLHCGKDFFTFSKGKKNHNNLYGPRGAACDKVQEILNDSNALYGNAANPGAITTALQAFYNGECVKSLLWNILRFITE